METIDYLKKTAEIMGSTNGILSSTALLNRLSLQNSDPIAEHCIELMQQLNEYSLFGKIDSQTLEFYVNNINNLAELYNSEDKTKVDIAKNLVWKLNNLKQNIAEESLELRDLHKSFSVQQSNYLANWGSYDLQIKELRLAEGQIVLAIDIKKKSPGFSHKKCTEIAAEKLKTEILEYEQEQAEFKKKEHFFREIKFINNMKFEGIPMRENDNEDLARERKRLIKRATFFMAPSDEMLANLSSLQKQILHDLQQKFVSEIKDSELMINSKHSFFKDQISMQTMHYLIQQANDLVSTAGIDLPYCNTIIFTFKTIDEMLENLGQRFLYYQAEIEEIKNKQRAIFINPDFDRYKEINGLTEDELGNLKNRYEFKIKELEDGIKELEQQFYNI